MANATHLYGTILKFLQSCGLYGIAQTQSLLGA